LPLATPIDRAWFGSAAHCMRASGWPEACYTYFIEATMAGKTTKPNLHRGTLRACLRVINTAATLGQARTELARLLNVIDKVEAQGIKGNAAVREAEQRLANIPPPKTSRADERPVRRRAGSA
jgi:hypothetical protein